MNALTAATRGLGWLGMAVFAATAAHALWRYVRTVLPSCDEPMALSEPSRREIRRLLGCAAAAFLASRALMMAVLLICRWCQQRTFCGFAYQLLSWLKRWDGNTYLSLIREGYVTTGEERYRLVFFPLYPMLCRALYLLGVPEMAAALGVSNVSLLLAAWTIGVLACQEGGFARGRLAVWLVMFCPATFFFSAAFTESLFLLLTSLTVLFSRRRRWGWALLFGALSTAARMPGLAVAAAVFWEMLRQARPRRLRTALRCAAGTLPVALGFAAYLGMNLALFGNALQFTVFEREVWHQSFGSLAGTIQYTAFNALRYSAVLFRWGTWGPQLIAILGSVALMAVCARRMRPSDAAASLLYMAVVFAPTWLLSGVRYLAGLYALYPLLAGLPRTGRSRAALLTASAAGMIYLTALGMWQGVVL